MKEQNIIKNIKNTKLLVDFRNTNEQRIKIEGSKLGVIYKLAYTIIELYKQDYLDEALWTEMKKLVDESIEMIKKPKVSMMELTIDEAEELMDVIDKVMNKKAKETNIPDFIKELEKKRKKKNQED